MVAAFLSVAVALGNEYAYGAWREHVGTKKDKTEEKQGEAEAKSGRERAGKDAREGASNATIAETPVEIVREGVPA